MSLYDIAGYGAMVADEARSQAYRDAMREKIGSGTTVLDIGTGTGLHALVACQLGARHVFAVEPSETIQVAREIARDNGFDDRITFIQDVSSSVSLPDPVDLLVSDLRGVLPFFTRHIPAIIDARDRLLRAGGAMIPMRDELRAAPVDAAGLYEQIVGPWETNGNGLDMAAARKMTTHHVHRRRVGCDELLAPPAKWAALDYASIEGPNARGAIDCVVERAGRMHGVSAWFDAELTDRVSFSNAPGEPDLVYGMAFFPLPEAIIVGCGDTVHIELSANLVGDDYVWTWNTSLIGAGESEASIRFEQSSFDGTPLSRRSLERSAADYVPRLSQDGTIDRDALQMIDGGASLREVATLLADRHPEVFGSREDALDRVAALSRRYAE